MSSIRYISALWKFRINSPTSPHPPPHPLQKCPPISFPAVTPTTIVIRPKKILTHSFNLFYHTCAKFQGHTYCQLQIIDLEPRAPLKKWFFWCSPSKIEVMITSVIKMLARVTNFWSYDHIFNVIWVTWWNFVGNVMDKNYNVITFIPRCL